jgi:hypothetical protein
MALRFSIFWDITQREVVIPYQRFGTTYRSHLRGSGSPKMFRGVGKCQSTPRKILEERKYHLDRGGSLKSRIVGMSALSDIHATSSEKSCLQISALKLGVLTAVVLIFPQHSPTPGMCRQLSQNMHHRVLR